LGIRFLRRLWALIFFAYINFQLRYDIDARIQQAEHISMAITARSLVRAVRFHDALENSCPH